VNIKFCVNLGKTPPETYEMLPTVYGDEALSRSGISEWFKGFKDGREGLQDDPRSGCPSTSRNADTIANVRKMVIRNCRWAIRKMAGELNINKKTIHQILHEDLRNREIRTKCVLHRLTGEQKQRRLPACQGFIQTRQDNPSFLDCIFLFSKVKTGLKGKRFHDVEDIKKNVTVEMNPVPLEALADCSQKLSNG
jgi:hypothetical protein